MPDTEPFHLTLRFNAPPAEAAKRAEAIADLCAAEFGCSDPRLTPADGDVAEQIAADLTKRNFFSWLLANGSSPLWAERTPEQEIGRMAAAVVAPELERLRAELAEAREENAYLHPAMRGAENRRQMWRERAERAEAERDAAHAAIARVRALHSPKIIPAVRSCGQHTTKGVCTSCETYETQVCSNITCCDWPCPTIAALDASSAPESPQEDTDA